MNQIWKDLNYILVLLDGERIHLEYPCGKSVYSENATSITLHEDGKRTLIIQKADVIAGYWEDNISTVLTVNDIITFLRTNTGFNTASGGSEVIINKQDSLAIDGTGVKHTTVDTVNAGLATKENNLPTIVGQSLKVLRVNASETDKEWATVGTTVTTITYSNLSTLKATSALVPYTTYHITDRDIWVEAVTTSELSVEGIRKMRTVLNTFYTSAGINLGVWNNTLTPSIGDFVVWGGRVWTNILGNVGTFVDDRYLDPIEWVEVVTLDATKYEDKLFKVIYDFDNDWVIQQSDDRGNTFGVSFIYSINFGYIYNFCDISDWGNKNVFDNNVFGVFNNANNGEINNNSNIGDIHANSNDGDIYYNSNVGDIYANSNGGDIFYNSNIGYIYSNSNVGRVWKNSNVGDIFYNSNDGAIHSNSNVGGVNYNSNVGGVNYNSNVGEIYANSNTGKVNYNSNVGGVNYNSNVGDIFYNSNVGDIFYNSNIGGVNYNSNVGGVNYNSNTGMIHNNANNGEIFYNSNIGGVNYNSNDGAIHSNSNVGEIYANSNNGAIIYNTQTSGTCSIAKNNNNGDISGARTANVIGTVVNI